MKRILTALAMTLALFAGLFLMGSQAQATTTATVSVAVHGVPNTPVNVFVNGKLTLTDFKPGTVAGPLQLPAGSYTVTVFPASNLKGTGTPVIQATATLTGGGNATLVAHLSAAGKPVLTAFVNDTAPIAAGKARVVVRHTAAAPAVDVRANAQAAFKDLANPNQMMADLPAGSVSADVVLAGTSTVVIGPATLDLAEGTQTIVYAVGSANAKTLSLVGAEDHRAELGTERHARLARAAWPSRTPEHRPGCGCSRFSVRCWPSPAGRRRSARHEPAVDMTGRRDPVTTRLRRSLLALVAGTLLAVGCPGGVVAESPAPPGSTRSAAARPRVSPRWQTHRLRAPRTTRPPTRRSPRRSRCRGRVETSPDPRASGAGPDRYSLAVDRRASARRGRRPVRRHGHPAGRPARPAGIGGRCARLRGRVDRRRGACRLRHPGRRRLLRPRPDRRQCRDHARHGRPPGVAVSRGRPRGVRETVIAVGRSVRAHRAAAADTGDLRRRVDRHTKSYKDNIIVTAVPL